MIDWYKKVVFENYANFNGRARRAEYWYYTLATIIISVILMVFDNLLDLKIGSSDQGILGSIYSLLVLVPGLAVATRRLHDIGKSGWILVVTYAVMIIAAVMIVMNIITGLSTGTSFSLMSFLPILVVLGLAIYMLVLFCTEGDRGDNQYGADPKSMVEEMPIEM